MVTDLTLTVLKSMDTQLHLIRAGIFTEIIGDGFSFINDRTIAGKASSKHDRGIAGVCIVYLNKNKIFLAYSKNVVF